jgi:hypothetical protein
VTCPTARSRRTPGRDVPDARSPAHRRLQRAAATLAIPEVNDLAVEDRRTHAGPCVHRILETETREVVAASASYHWARHKAWSPEPRPTSVADRGGTLRLPPRSGSPSEKRVLRLHTWPTSELQVEASTPHVVRAPPTQSEAESRPPAARSTYRLMTASTDPHEDTHDTLRR